MAMTSNQRNTAVFLATAGMVGLASAVYLNAVGTSDEMIKARDFT